MLPKAYDPKATEDRIYRMWEDSGAFKADANSAKEPFSVAMPPPNATGQLHIGHAGRMATEDILIRFARMRGKETLWVPGTDHAAIATENVVIKMLKEQGMADPRAALGREKFVARITEYVEASRSVIRNQIKKMGSSCDWSRERYTLEPALNRCVNEVFAMMHHDGLVYRGHRIVNWDPLLKTTVSDDEVVWVEETAPFYTFQYGPFQIGTVRPETKFGDKYVVMHPDDARYAAFKHGQTLELEWINGPIRATVIKDTAVDPAFGTGVMTITPWHTQIDFEIAERHGLEKEQIIGFDGMLLPIAGEFAGMGIELARPKIVQKLKAKGLLVNVDPHYVHRKAVSQRGKGTIEPQVKLQWFIDVRKPAVLWKGATMSLKEIMHEVVHHGDIAIIPERFANDYFHWIDNLRDWCISRQIWWGHRVPAWTCVGDTACKLECREPIVAADRPRSCPHCGSQNLEQDPDTLDTWFSSALWTWSTLIDPALTQDSVLSPPEMLRRSPEFQKFHPTSVLETAHDILFFWVARMILITTYVMSKLPEIPHEEKIPFRTVYLSGLVRTRDGRKMSKSDPETMIDPLDMISRYGADALRLSMIVGQSPGTDFRLYEEKIAGYRNFVNKLWNAARFVLLECEKAGIDPCEVPPLKQEYGDMSLADRALLSHVLTLVRDVTKGLQEYRLSEVGEKLYSFVWDFFCDWYLELSKGEQKNIPMLVDILRLLLQLLHPYCPFVTEELWFSLRQKNADYLIKQSWPRVMGGKDEDAEEKFQIIIDVITAIREMRADYGIESSKQVHVIIHSDKHLDLIQSQREHIMRLAKCDQWTLDAVPTKHANAASAFLPDIEIHVLLATVMDSVGERKRLEQERAELERYIAVVRAKLDNPAFVKRAPASVVTQEQRKLRSAEERLKKMEGRSR